MLSLSIDCVPMPAPRPKFKTSESGKKYTYMPKEYQEFKKLIGYAARTVTGGVILTSPIKLDITFRKNLEVTNRKFGDIDNLAKSVLDGLNGVLFKDDSQVTGLSLHKMSSDKEGIDIYIFLE